MGGIPAPSRCAGAQHPDMIDDPCEHRGDHRENLRAPIRKVRTHRSSKHPDGPSACPPGSPRWPPNPHVELVATGPDCAMMQTQKVPPVFETVTSNTTIVAAGGLFRGRDHPHTPTNRWNQSTPWRPQPSAIPSPQPSSHPATDTEANPKTHHSTGRRPRRRNTEPIGATVRGSPGPACCPGSQ